VPGCFARRLVLLALVAIGGPGGTPSGEPSIATEALRFTGPLHESEDLSAVEVLDGSLVIASDEGDRIQVLRPLEDGLTYRAVSEGVSLISAGEEIDIEGLARDGSTVFVLGSHAVKRKRVKSDRSRQENRKRLATVAPEAPRHRIFRLQLNPETGEAAGPVKSISLRALLEKDPILGPFTKIPGKENGVNIEGIAFRDSRLYLGFRGPVLRGGYVPVMVLSFDEPRSYELLFVRLGGRGIRAMAPVSDGFLVMAAFERPQGRPFELYLWDGEDQVPGNDAPASVLRRLAEWPLQIAGDAEALVVLAETDDAYSIVVVHDNSPGGSPTRARIPKQ
jgi:hypothetical protein